MANSLRKDLIEALTQLQNHRALVNQDILTFTGFMDDAEVKLHLEACHARITRWAEAA